MIKGQETKAAKGSANMADDASREKRNNKKSRAPIGRTLFLMALCGLVAFVVLAIRLYKLQSIDSSYYASRALQDQLSKAELRASRGTIYDANGKILAMSAEVENVFISPYEFERDGQDAGFIAAGLSEILGVPRETIDIMAERTYSQYEVVKYKVESEEAGRVREFIREFNLKGIHLEIATKRYYPNNNLACQVLGFVGTGDIGREGLEQRYDSLLTGTNGRKIQLKNGNGKDLLFPDYDDRYAALDGDSITLTIDASIQYYIEKHLEQAIIDYDVQNGASCIAIDPKTGAILALANYPNYDPNDFQRLGDRELEKLSAIGDGPEYTEAFKAALYRQWRNRALTDTYEPGSVFKIMTLAIALEENPDALTGHYFCEGSVEVAGREEDDLLHCWNLYGHDDQTLGEAMQNSCNIASVELALQMGPQVFYKNIRAFGLFDKTGLDNNVEGRGLWWDESVFFDRNNRSQLASASFGQTFKVTPIQMITAAAATINGGYLMQPYIVRQIADSAGNIIEAAEPTVLRQVISAETSAIVRSILEGVVDRGTGKNAQVKGYRIGGKTGTSENVEQLSAEEENDDLVKDYIVSFIGFAPAEDPEIMILLILDTPSHETGINISGGAMAAPAVGGMLADILPLCLGIKPQYTQEDLLDINIYTPRVSGKSVEEAQELLGEQGFNSKVVGDGANVTGQFPAPNAYVASGTTVILYAGADPPTGQATVPHLSGLSYNEAKQELESCGMFIRTTGAPKSDSRAEVSVQSVSPGERTAYGSVIEVTLINKDAVARD